MSKSTTAKATKLVKITDIFSKRPILTPEVNNDQDKNCNLNEVQQPVQVQNPNDQRPTLNTSEPEHSSFITQTDIAFFVKEGYTFSPGERHQIITGLGLSHPEISFKYPLKLIGKQNRCFQRSWLEKYQWLSYSMSEDKCYCRFCVVFKKIGCGQSKLPFATLGYDNWKNANEKFELHQKSQNHIDASILAESFLKTIENKSSIACSINKQRRDEVDNNRKILASIIETIILCGRQNIALRGDKDSGKFGEEDPSHNDGNFRSLLRFRIKCGDAALLNHFTFGKSNAMYTSPTIQNTIIDICGTEILKKIIHKVEEAKYFSILVDETTDISTTEQLSLCVRYVDPETHNIVEDFLGFTQVTNLSGEGLTETILSEISRLNLNIKYLRGQSYDGAANMSAKFKGVQTRILEMYPTAIYTYCASHKLNLVVSDSCSTTEIRNCIGTIKEVQTFFSRSPKRLDVLKKCILEGEDENVKKTRLINICATRWVERHDALQTFAELFIYILSSLEAIERTGDKDSQNKSHILLKSMENSSFIIALKSCQYIFSFTVILSKALQSPDIDLHKCYEMVLHLLAVLGSVKENSTEEFKKIYTEVRNIAEFCGIEIAIPRQAKRRNPQCAVESAEAYFRINVFIPFLEHTITALEGRFENHQSSINNIYILIPKYAVQTNDLSSLKKLKQFYHEDLMTSEETFESEFKLWVEKWKRTEPINWPKSIADLLQQCEILFYPSIHTLLKILCTIPVTTATAERSFSCLKRLKSYLRNKMGDERLTGLAMLNVHRDANIDVAKVLEIFALQKNHRIPLMY